MSAGLGLDAWWDEPAYQASKETFSERGAFILAKLGAHDAAKLEDVLADVYRAALPDPADMTKFDSCEVRQAAHPASLRVFVGERGGRYYRFADHFWSALHRAGPRDSGIGVHTLRHSWATRMVAAGCDLVLLMQLDGWSSLAMVQRYAHPSDRGAQAVATMLAARPGSESPRQSPRAVRELGRTS